MMKKFFSGLGLFALLLSGAVLFGNSIVRAASPFPASTNEVNKTKNWAHVNQISIGPGETTLQFVSTRSFASCFEYRTDGDTSQALGTPNPNIEISDRYPHVCVNNSTLLKDFTANEYVEVRLSFGAESDERFDWTRFDVEKVPTPTPTITPAPTSAPVSDPANKEYSHLYVEPVSCSQEGFRVEMDLKAGDFPQQDVLVAFTYNGMQKNAYTNKDGRASTSFAFAGLTSVKAIPNNGYATQEKTVTQADNCQVGSVLGATTDTSAGVTTYAATGVVADSVMSLVGLIGATMTTVGAALHAKKKN